MLDPAIAVDVENSVLCWLATVDPAGTPNVTPKEIFALYGDDRLVIADIASANSVRNIRANPQVCVSFVDIFRQHGFKLAGSATILAPGDAEFPVAGAELLRMAGGAFPVRHVISVRIEQASRIWAPSYRLRPDQTDEQRRHSAYRAYGVTPVSREASA